MSNMFHPNPSTTFWDTVLYIVFGPISQWWRITEIILVASSRSRSSPNSNQFVRVTHPTCPPNFIRIRPQLFEISCTQKDRQTERGENITSFTFGGRSNKRWRWSLKIFSQDLIKQSAKNPCLPWWKKTFSARSTKSSFTKQILTNLSSKRHCNPF